MLTISKPLSAGQAHAYHHEEFSNAQENYYSEGDRIRSEWQGRLAEKWELHGEVREDHFHRLSEGQHPITGEQLIRHQAAREYMNRRGDQVSPMEHRAGWDATFSAPKSVSLTALVGGDDRVREAHRESVAVALDELERYTQARLGGNLPAETTGKWVAAKFEHDSARPVDGYAAPQLHTHVVFFNLTETEDGEAHALQPRELYKTQQYATAVYRSELAHRLKGLGYETERGESSQPEIKGYSKEYLEASSPRRRQIEEHLAKHDQRGAGAAQIAAHQTRQGKLELSHEAMQERHHAMAEAFGNQPERVVEGAHVRREQLKEELPKGTISQALTYSREKNLEREAVADERELLRDALKRSMGDARVAEVKAEFEKRVQAGEFIETSNRAPGRAFTTSEMIEHERKTIQVMRSGQNQYVPIASFKTRRETAQDHSHLSESQRAAVEQILSSRDQVAALEGVAGAGKTTSLAAIREAAERDGYKVEGFAPTSRAAQKLGEAGIESSTLQRHLARSQEPHDGQQRLYVLDESSLASTKQMNDFLHRLKENDRVLLVGDTRQHEAVEAGRPYHQLQEAGIATARLQEIVRQKDSALRDVVEKLSRGQVKEAMEKLDAQGRMHEILDRDERMASIAHEYMKQPEGTLVVSADNQSRMEINQTIHYAMQDAGKIPYREHEMTVLVARQEITGADRQWATQYEPGDVVRYTRGSKTQGIEAGEYARVEHANEKENLVTVKRKNGQQVSYDPRRLHGVTLYRETERGFSQGDRVQLTAPNRERHIANRELGTIEKIDDSGNLQLRLDSGRTVAFNIKENPHLDYGYAITSHSSQGQTADRVLIHVDTEQAGEKLVNRRLAYVAVSRGRYDAQVYTNDKGQLAGQLSRDVSRRSAIEASREFVSPAREIEPSTTRSQGHEHTQAEGHSISR
ncbi:MAG: conjugal transfer protein [Acidobacteria bacterium 13_1_20CM_4_57_11]|nr:MAG: conjugal transfer protein [Acidobacteria bacterium 13_1_20CM_4_57_11]